MIILHTVDELKQKTSILMKLNNVQNVDEVSPISLIISNCCEEHCETSWVKKHCLQSSYSSYPSLSSSWYDRLLFICFLFNFHTRFNHALIIKSVSGQEKVRKKIKMLWYSNKTMMKSVLVFLCYCSSSINKFRSQNLFDYWHRRCS